MCNTFFAGRCSAYTQYTITGNVACDNEFAIFTAAAETAPMTVSYANFRGCWSTAVAVNFTTSDRFLYIACWSDDQTAQGLLHDLAVNGNPAFSSSPLWSVTYANENYSSCLGTPPAGMAATMAAVIPAPPGGWVPPALGCANPPPAGPFCYGVWPHVPSINVGVQWSWHDSGMQPGANAPFQPGFNHREFLIFRLDMGDACDDSPLAHYTFDNNMNIGEDSSGNGHQGTKNCVVVPAPCGNALRFHGDNDTDEFSIGHHNDLNLVGAMTGMALIRPRGQQSLDNNPSCPQGTIFTKGGNYWFQVEPLNNKLGLQNEGSGSDYVTTDVSLCINFWTHVAFVRVPTVNGHDVQFYANGLPIGPVLTLANNPVPNNDPVVVGNSSPSGMFCEFNGDIDEIRIYDRALSAAEVQEAFYCGCPFPIETCWVTRSCFGDGSASPCPCGNNNGPSTGCANSTGQGAALAVLGGTNSISANDLILTATNAIPGQTGLFFQGDTVVNGGNGVGFGDGLRCCGTNTVRIEIVVGHDDGSAISSDSISGDGGVSPGETKCYQYWYRNPSGSPCGAGFNLTNALSVIWQG